MRIGIYQKLGLSNSIPDCELVGVSTVKIRDRFLIENGTASPRIALERAKEIRSKLILCSFLEDYLIFCCVPH